MKKLAMITAVVGLITTASLRLYGDDQSWQDTLRQALERVSDTNMFWLVGEVSSMRVHFTVPAEAAKILESRPRTELMSFLTQLRATSKGLNTFHLDYWEQVANRGLHGKAAVYTNILLSTKQGVAIPVFEYSYSLFDGENEQKKP